MFLFRQILRTLSRRRFKSAVVLLVSLILVLFINIYVDTISQYQQTLAELHATIEVTGHIISLDGSTNDLVIS